MNYAAAIRTIQRYLDEKLPEPVRPPNPKAVDSFEERSHSRWAANELMERIMDEELKLPYHISGLEQKIPVEIAKEFIDELQYCWANADDPEKKRMFAAATYTVEDILSLLYF